MKPLIEVEEDGFSVRFNASAERMPWSAITSVVAFKRDTYIVDLICLAIQVDEGKIMEVNEEMSGWSALVMGLAERLPGFPSFEDWFRSVAFPAFKTNTTVLFDRGGITP